MLDSEVIKGFREKYSNVHPLVFHRSLERAKTAVELFDILDSIPEYPIIWSESEHKWVKCTDILNTAKISDTL